MLTRKICFARDESRCEPYYYWSELCEKQLQIYFLCVNFIFPYCTYVWVVREIIWPWGRACACSGLLTLIRLCPFRLLSLSLGQTAYWNWKDLNSQSVTDESHGVWKRPGPHDRSETRGSPGLITGHGTYFSFLVFVSCVKFIFEYFIKCTLNLLIRNL